MFLIEKLNLIWNKQIANFNNFCPLPCPPPPKKSVENSKSPHLAKP